MIRRRRSGILNDDNRLIVSRRLDRDDGHLELLIVALSVRVLVLVLVFVFIGAAALEAAATFRQAAAGVAEETLEAGAALAGSTDTGAALAHGRRGTGTCSNSPNCTQPQADRQPDRQHKKKLLIR